MGLVLFVYGPGRPCQRTCTILRSMKRADCVGRQNSKLGQFCEKLGEFALENKK